MFGSTQHERLYAPRMCMSRIPFLLGGTQLLVMEFYLCFRQFSFHLIQIHERLHIDGDGADCRGIRREGAQNALPSRRHLAAKIHKCGGHKICETGMWPKQCIRCCPVDTPHLESRVEWSGEMPYDKNKFDLLCSHFLFITVIFLCSITSGD